MRFFTPKHGEQRTIKKFLWFPVTINKETRWLETAIIRQEYKIFIIPEYDGWRNISFEN